MVGVATGPFVEAGWVEITGASGLLQAVDPTAVFDLPRVVRGVAAFAIVLALGALVVWRFGPFLARSIEASLERPVASVGYGAAANVVIVFGGVYLTSQLAQLSAGGWNAWVVGVAVGLLLVLLATALGFTVVGSTVAALWLADRPWAGPVVGAALAGGAAALDPLVGGLVWFVVVAIGIGGPARRWVHASEGPDPADVRRG